MRTAICAVCGATPLYLCNRCGRLVAALVVMVSGRPRINDAQGRWKHAVRVLRDLHDFNFDVFAQLNAVQRLGANSTTMQDLIKQWWPPEP